MGGEDSDFYFLSLREPGGSKKTTAMFTHYKRNNQTKLLEQQRGKNYVDVHEITEKDVAKFSENESVFHVDLTLPTKKGKPKDDADNWDVRLRFNVCRFNEPNGKKIYGLTSGVVSIEKNDSDTAPVAIFLPDPDKTYLESMLKGKISVETMLRLVRGGEI